jgi:hypothetical protein
MRPSPVGTSATNWPIVPSLDDRLVWSIWCNENWHRKSKYSEKTCPNSTLSTTNLTCLELGSNLDRRGGEPATNRLSYGMASFQIANAPGKYANTTAGFSLISLSSSMGIPNSYLRKTTKTSVETVSVLAEIPSTPRI